MSQSTSIRVENLTYRVEGKTILRNLCLTAEAGQILAVIGLSGAGKSSLLKCIGGLIKPDAGRIFWGDQEIVGLPESQLNSLRRRIGFVFQGGALFDFMTVYDNIAFALKRQKPRPSPKEIQQIVTEKLRLVGMEGAEHLFPDQLSGGMQKRVSLARALATNPDILLYDEPTSGLDPILSSAIDQLIVNMKQQFGVTSILVTHNVSSVFRVADTIAMLHKGEIIFTGSPEEIQATSHPVVRQFVEGSLEGPLQPIG